MERSLFQKRQAELSGLHRNYIGAVGEGGEYALYRPGRQLAEVEQPGRSSGS